MSTYNKNVALQLWIFVVQCYSICWAEYSNVVPDLMRHLPDNNFTPKSADYSAFCPVSTSKWFHLNGMQHYPLDVFSNSKQDPPLRNNNTTVSCFNTDSLNPSNYEDFSIIFHNCSKSSVFCPITKRIVDETTVTSSVWHKTVVQSPICKFRNHLLNSKESVNVLVIGNSETVGVNAAGCNDKSEQSNLDNNPNGKHLIEWRKNDYCSWPYYLDIWLAEQSKANYRFHMKGKRGMTSKLAANVIGTILKYNGMVSSKKKLSSRDVVFLDFAITDSAFFPSQSQVDSEVEPALTALINKIYGHSNSKDLPLIIILEIEPRDKLENSNWFKGIDGAPYILRNMYKRVASKFNLPFWSYRDAVNNGYKDSTSGLGTDIPYLPVLKFNNAVRKDSHHPAWFTHLYMADLFAATMLREFNVCDGVVEASTVSEKNTDSAHACTQQQTSTGGASTIGTGSDNSSSVDSNGDSRVVPDSNAVTEPFSSVDCDINSDALISVSYEAVVSNQPIIGSFESAHWKTGVDWKGRGGFIYKLPQNQLCKL